MIEARAHNESNPRAQIKFVNPSAGSSNFPSMGEIQFHTGTFNFSPNQGPFLRMVITHQGNVGIGVSSPSQRLEVDGNLRLRGADLIINNPGRSGAANATRRALVHDFSDRLSLNYGSDYAGGIMLYGNVGVGVENPNSNTAERVRINGNLAIVDNSGDNQIKMYQDGTIKAREIHVMVSSETIADYVFRDDYELMSLHALKEYINDKGHLPNIPSAEEFGERGEMNLGEMDNLLLEKVEELTLYILQLEERIAELESGE
jgi:hypothetical protein